MYRTVLGSALVLSFSVLSCGLVAAAVAPVEPSTTQADAPSLAQTEPNQDNLQMLCNGSISVNNVDYTVQFTRSAGFSRIELRQRGSGQVIANTTLSFSGTNAKGQAIWRGSVLDAASVVLVHLSTRPAQVGDEVSVGYDGQWGRGTCARSTRPL